jgi:toxin secretion/phage lysis holin
MFNITLTKASFMGVLGTIGGVIVQLLGGWTSDLKTLVFFMGIDIIMGFLIAVVWKKSPKTDTGAAGSLAMWQGLCRKGVSLLFVLVANQLEQAIGLDFLRTAVIIAFLVDELISMVENAGIMGLKLPTVLINAIDILKKKEGEK